ncbi:MAG: DNA repair protein RecO [Candidatus Yanofskybacteria bacterium]|nr:DNA repair protein RecO [Candidatus Yanofskybacteria bacterium]
MQTKAIILKKQNTNEYDQWVTCYTEEFGKLKTVAKSILKPNSIQALHLDIFNLTEFELINGRGMPIITGAQVIDPFRGIKNSLVKTAVAYFFAEAIDKMVFDNDKDDELWSFLVSLLVELNKDDTSPVQLLRQGQSRLLDVLGYLPETGSCKVCDDKLNDGELGAFNQEFGGIVCKRCFLSGHGGILISRDDFNLLRNNGARERWGRSVLDGMFEYISGSKFSSLDLLAVLK